MLSVSCVLPANLLVLLPLPNAMSASLVPMPLNLAHPLVLHALLAPLRQVKLALISLVHYARLVPINLSLVALAVLLVPLVRSLMPLVLLHARLAVLVPTLTLQLA